MKKLFFLILLTFSFQVFSQIEPGIYTSNETWSFKWDENGYEDGGKLMDKEPFFIEFNDYGFRIYMKEGNVGKMYPAMYVKNMDGWEVYSVYPDERLEYKDGHILWFFNFNDDTGYYMNSTEFKNVKKVK